ncbi:hypothetical protein AVEN_192389-1 [Araneus ventricosus]|uniref:Uncharacterized protein n=1 Tax=Araneus ventricosus TaxID=182803 RepID=A0A4Y2H3Q7_ARAVE|nr:hypothetical protein AVEN_192389-1 [Araneus ventricosus]
MQGFEVLSGLAWQDLFFDIADVIWAFLPESRYEDLLFKIYDSIDSSGYYFPNFFQNLFLHSLIEFRRYFVDEEIRKGYFFLTFFINEDRENYQRIFRNVDAADRVRLVSFAVMNKI